MSLPDVSSATEHDQLPFATRIGNQMALAWVRHDTTQALPWLNPKSALFYATSLDGIAWTAPAAVTDDAGAVANLFPQIYLSHDGTWALAWLSTKFGSPRVLELPWNAVDRYPMALVARSQLPEGYSHRVVATPTRGVYLGVWVQGPEGAQDIYYRFFER